MKDLSTLEYLYVFRCCSASSETHSCFAVSATVSEHSCRRANARKGGGTFARRHLGTGDRERERHECGGNGEIYTNCNFKPCKCGESCSRANSCGVGWQMESLSHRGRQTSKGPAGFDRTAGIRVCERARHWRSTSSSCCSCT